MLLRILGISALALAMTAVAAQATAIRDVAIVDIPYAVELHGQMLPPGEYWVRDVRTMGYQTNVLNLYKAGGQEFVASVHAQPAYRVEPSATNEVDFGETANGTHYLDKIWLGTYHWGFDIPKAAMTQ